MSSSEHIMITLRGLVETSLSRFLFFLLNFISISSYWVGWYRLICRPRLPAWSPFIGFSCFLHVSSIMHLAVFAALSNVKYCFTGCSSRQTSKDSMLQKEWNRFTIYCGRARTDEIRSGSTNTSTRYFLCNLAAENRSLPRSLISMGYERFANFEAPC